MLSLLDLRFVFCSRDLNVLRAQRIIGFFYRRNYPQINEVEKADHVIVIECVCCVNKTFRFMLISSNLC